MMTFGGHRPHNVPWLDGALRRRLGGRLAQGNPGFQQPLAVVRDVRRILPAEISQMPFDRQIWKSVEQNLRRLPRLLASPRLREGGRPYREHLEMIWIEVR